MEGLKLFGKIVVTAILLAGLYTLTSYVLGEVGDATRSLLQTDSFIIVLLLGTPLVFLAFCFKFFDNYMKQKMKNTTELKRT